MYRRSANNREGREIKWTSRQRQVLGLLTKNYTNPEIANELGISLDGAKWHVRELIGTLGVSSREQVADYWRQQNSPRARISRAFAAPTVVHTVAWIAGGVAGGLAIAGLVVALLVIHNLQNESGHQAAISSPTSGPDISGNSVAPNPSVTAAATASALPTGSAGTATAPPRISDQVLNMIIIAVENQDNAGFSRLLRSTFVECDTDQLTIAPDCGGASIGARIEALWSFQCQASWVATSALTAVSTLLYAPYKLYAVTDGGPAIGRGSAAHPATAWLLFKGMEANLPEMMAVGVSDSGVGALGYSCGAAVGLLEKYAPASSKFIIPPVSSP